MTTSSQINDLGEFLSKHNAKTLNKPSTHTRIASPEMNIYGGNYSIEKEELELYYCRVVRQQLGGGNIQDLNRMYVKHCVKRILYFQVQEASRRTWPSN